MHVMVAAALLLQEGSAAAVLDKILAAVRSAPAVDARFSYHTDRKGRMSETFLGEGRLLLKAPNKVRVEIGTVTGTSRYASGLTADGKAWSRDADGRPLSPEAPPRLEFAARFAFARSGALGAQELVARIADGLKLEDADMDKVYRVSDAAFVASPDTREASITYKLVVDMDGKPAAWDVRLWYMPKSFIPLKRALRFKNEGVEVETTEAYTKYGVKEDVRDEVFGPARDR